MTADPGNGKLCRFKAIHHDRGPCMPALLPAHETWSSPAPDRLGFLLHGIYGAARNWRSFGKRFVERCPQWRVIGVDLRNHGDSQGAPPPHTLEACSDDLIALAGRTGAPEVIWGHSFGGKVALVHASRRPAGLRELWLLDSPAGPPVKEGASDNEAGRVLRAMGRLPLPVANRGEAIRLLQSQGIGGAVATWLATNLVPDPAGGFRWCFDLHALEEMLQDYWRIDGRALLLALPDAIAIHVVRGGRSDRWSADELHWLAEQERAGRLTVHLLPNAAHWLQADDPDGLLDLFASRFG